VNLTRPFLTQFAFAITTVLVVWILSPSRTHETSNLTGSFPITPDYPIQRDWFVPVGSYRFGVSDLALEGNAAGQPISTATIFHFGTWSAVVPIPLKRFGGAIAVIFGALLLTSVFRRHDRQPKTRNA
jgi:hypothetical protein